MNVFSSFLEVLKYFFLWRARDTEFRLKDYANKIIAEEERESDELEKQINDLRIAGRDNDADELRRKNARRAIYLQSIVSLSKGWDKDSNN